MRNALVKKLEEIVTTNEMFVDTYKDVITGIGNNPEDSMLYVKYCKMTKDVKAILNEHRNPVN